MHGEARRCKKCHGDARNFGTKHGCFRPKPIKSPAMKEAYYRLLQRARSAVAGLTRPAIDQEFIKTAPSPQHALDIFKGEWLSALPSPLTPCRAGTLPLFGDPRIKWAVEQWGGVQGRKVIELGPLEGGHSWMLEQMGAAEVIAVEASTRAYLKCLTLKELTGMTRVRFLCGDSVGYLRENPAQADAILASGILYHMTNPVELIAEIAAHTDRMFLWTCYHDAEIIARNQHLAARFGPPRAASHAGFAHTVHPFHYRATRFRLGFSGGVASYSHWLTRDTILQALRHFGLDRIETAFEEPGHANGPAFALVASRTR